MTHTARFLSPHGKPGSPKMATQAAFTLVELLVSMTVLTVLLLIVTNVISETQKAWSSASSRTTQFREARAAFDLMTRNLSQATLNTYWDYQRSDYTNPLEPPTKYERKSELAFNCGPGATLLTGSGGTVPTHAIFFQAPLGVTQDGTNAGLNNLMCARGYFVRYGTDAPFLPGFLPTRYAKNRFRLMEYSQPAERNRVYMPDYRPLVRGTAWFEQDALSAVTAGENDSDRSPSRPIAENIIALVISPRLSPRESGSEDPTSIAKNYAYDSTQRNSNTDQGTQHLIPPLLDVTMVALDDPSAEKLELLGHGPSIPNDAGAAFTTVASYETDIEKLEQHLIEKRLNFRIFRTTIAMRSSKWSL
jgi:uncharacterized protein (TIGR02599 family)